MYYGYLGTNHRCPDYQGLLIFQVSSYVLGLVWIMQVSLFQVSLLTGLELDQEQMPDITIEDLLKSFMWL